MIVRHVDVLTTKYLVRLLIGGIQLPGL